MSNKCMLLQKHRRNLAKKMYNTGNAIIPEALMCQVEEILFVVLLHCPLIFVSISKLQCYT